MLTCVACEGCGLLLDKITVFLLFMNVDWALVVIDILRLTGDKWYRLVVAVTKRF